PEKAGLGFFSTIICNGRSLFYPSHYLASRPYTSPLCHISSCFCCSLRHRPAGSHLRGASLAPVGCHSRCLSLSGTPAPAPASRFLLEMCVGSPLSVREPPSFQTKEETRWLPTTQNPLIRCDAATSRPRSGRMSARRVRSSQRPSLGPSRISP